MSSLARCIHSILNTSPQGDRNQSRCKQVKQSNTHPAKNTERCNSLFARKIKKTWLPKAHSGTPPRWIHRKTPQWPGRGW